MQDRDIFSLILPQPSTLPLKITDADMNLQRLYVYLFSAKKELNFNNQAIKLKKQTNNVSEGKCGACPYSSILTNINLNILMFYTYVNEYIFLFVFLNK